jgi:hypothetical protein
MEGFPGYNRPRNQEPSLVPAKIRYLFQPGTDIPKMFEWMERRYHLHPDWHKQFKDDLKKTPKDLPEQEFFFHWATQHINPALQTIVRRKANIIEDIAIYLLKDRIEEKRKEQEDRVKSYKGAWKNETKKI